jgi:hypothetical protein
MALFLTSEESSYCTGAEFVIDRGLLAGLPFAAGGTTGHRKSATFSTRDSINSSNLSVV